MEYRLRSGARISDEDIERLGDKAEGGILPGDGWEGKPVMGRPRLTDEPLVTVPVKFPSSVVAEIDSRSDNRSEFIRRAVMAAL